MNVFQGNIGVVFLGENAVLLGMKSLKVLILKSNDINAFCLASVPSLSLWTLSNW